MDSFAEKEIVPCLNLKIISRLELVTLSQWAGILLNMLWNDRISEFDLRTFSVVFKFEIGTGLKLTFVKLNTLSLF